MTRTKQTARRSTGGLAPRRQLATFAARSSFSSGSSDMSSANDRLQRQMDLYRENENKRTITVEGTSELMEAPDLVHLTFKTTAEASTLPGAIRGCMDKIAKLRAIAVGCGVDNSNIASDSIGTNRKRLDYGRHVPPTKKQIEDEEYDEDDKVWKKIRSKLVFEAEAIVRVTLQVETTTNNDEDDADTPSLEISKLFSKVCYSLLNNEDSIVVMNDAPVYELSDITNLRNEARKDACSNAKQKATFIIDALGDKSVKLGKPVCFTDVHIDINDDAHHSFLGNFGNTNSPSSTVQIDLDQEEGNDDRASGGKRKRGGDNTDENDDETRILSDEEIASIFTVPPIKVAACIKAVFEVDTEAKV
mmetsp:Transcript_27918/g.42266  ORF Transcript_27918/g.42266 Transcript_27918/m.42266 type:complete len:361 (+) Transcript_27918:69-1151(+)